jgi:hypothetical protein
MYGVVLMAALVSGGEVAGGYSCNGCGYGYGYAAWGGACLGPCLPTGLHSGGRFWLGLFEGWQVGKPLSAEEEKRWRDYVERLEGIDRQNMDAVWASADVSAKRKLLELLAEMEKKWAAKGVEEAPAEAPLSAEEQKKWDAYVKKLEGDKKKEAEERWKKADVKGKREILKTLPKEDE